MISSTNTTTSSEAISPNAISGCVLAFSGGRDSTIAALRLARTFPVLKLVTVSTSHLIGAERVITRLIEIRNRLPVSTEWLHFTYTREVETGSELVQTCLPCQAVYAAAVLHTADQYGIDCVAFGYTDYQSAWAEQTPAGRAQLALALAKRGKSVKFPVADLCDKEQAKRELQENGMTDSALEQTCLRQQRNDNSQSAILDAEIVRWGKTLDVLLSDNLAAVQLVRAVSLSEVKQGDVCFRII